MTFSEADRLHMQRALELSKQGEGHVEPNPMVGCVIAENEHVLAEGWHQHFGGPHAEVEALRRATDDVSGKTMYVTLEPCCHQGKTPPCCDQILAAGIQRVVIARYDPFPQVAGQGIDQLKSAGLQVEVGLLAEEAADVLAPFEKLISIGHPWVIAKWAMTLDGRIASRTGTSQWISGEASRAMVHALRGRCDAILVGRGTVEHDDPLLTARPPGTRTALRIVMDSLASLDLDSQLVRTAESVPVCVAVGPHAPQDNCFRLQDAGCEVLRLAGESHEARLSQLMEELGQRRMTNLMVEGGGHLIGSLFDQDFIDEVHVFVAPKLVGGAQAPGPLQGRGLESIDLARRFTRMNVERCDDDIYVHGRLTREHMT